MINQKHFKYIISLFVFILAFSFFYNAQNVKSTNLFISPDQMNVSEGEEFDVEIIVDSQGQTINAVESIIKYSTSSLEVVGINRSESIVDVWITPPSVSREKGIIEFLGGSQSGVGGSALKVLDIRFRALEESIVDISF